MKEWGLGAMLSRHKLYYGREQPPVPRQELRAGPLSLIFENGDLRYIKLGEREVVRRLYVAVRDRDWGTLPAQLSALRVETRSNSFEISFQAEHKCGDIDFRWQAHISGDERGTIKFSMEGIAQSTFWSNRVGFCLLHPVQECAGRPCVVETIDGSRTSGRFPLYVSPHQPFLNMRAIAHEVAPGLWAEVRLEGDTFEMEDQRNWTDASYKTYSRPLALPYPFAIMAGTAICQSVTISLNGEAEEPALAAVPVSPSVFLGQVPLGPLPRLGLSVGSWRHHAPANERGLARLRRLNLAHLHVELALAEAGWQERLRQATAEAQALGLPIAVAITISDAAAAELAALCPYLEENKPDVCAWFIFHHIEKCASTKWVHLARQLLSSYQPGAGFAAGSDANFTELNRGQPPLDLLDMLCYALNPQVHAFDDTSIVETLEGQAWTIASAKRLACGLPLAVGPITLRKRAGAGGEAVAEPEVSPRQADPRQMSLLGAGWTLGSLQRLAEGGVYSATYYETTGPLGLMADVSENGVFPMYHVFADVGELAGGVVLPVLVSDPLKLAGLALRGRSGTRLLLANLTPERQEVTVYGLDATVWLRYLDESNAEEAMLSPEAFREQPPMLAAASGGTLVLNLLPYAVARVDIR